MDLIRFCMNHPVTVSVGVLLLTLFGLLSLAQIPVQLVPTVDAPVVMIQTTWPGANPQEVEREVIDRQEEMLRSVKGLRKMTSQSLDDMGTIRLEFKQDVDLDLAVRDVSEKLRQVKGYPVEVDEPTINTGDNEFDVVIAWLILYTREGNDAEVRKMRDFAEDFIQPYLDRVPGVAFTDIYGGYEREVQITVDAGRLAARGLTFMELRDALQEQNSNISAGTRPQGKRDYAIRTVGQYESLDEVRETVIASTASGPIYVRDVADVQMGFKDPEGLVRSSGQFVLAFPISRETGANVVEVMRELREAIRRINVEVLQARDMSLELVQVYDETVYIEQAMEMVRSNIVFGSAMVLGLLLAFLRNWRATVVLALTIPVSIIGTFTIIAALGRTLNVISLAGLAFAVGDVVDSAYVVLENIFRHKQMGKSIVEAVYDGTREVWGPVLASTLTTAAVFVPVIFIQEEAGQLFRDISIAQVAAVTLSMLTALAVIPPLATRLMKTRVDPRFPADDAQRSAADVARDPVLRFAGFVAAIVRMVNRSLLRQMVVIVGLVAGSLLLAALLIPPATYLPSGNRNLVFGFLLTPPGYSIAEYTDMARKIEAVISPYWQVQEGSREKAELDKRWVQQVQGMIAAGAIPELTNPEMSALEQSRIRREWLTPPPVIDNFFFVTFGPSAFMGAVSGDPARVKPLVRLLETSGRAIPGTYAFFMQAELFSFGGGNSAEIQVRGDDLEKVNAAAQSLMMACMQTIGFPRPDPANFNLGRPELRVAPDRERAADLGLTAADMGFIVEACGDGAYVGDFRVSGGDTVDLTLRVAGQDDKPTADVGNVPIATPSGRVVPLSAGALLTYTTAQEQINHIERQRSVTLTVTPPEAMALEAAISQIQNQIVPSLRDAGQIDPSVTVSMTGNADKLVAAREAMLGEWEGFNLTSVINLASGRFLLSILIVYLVMCALYESWLYPFVIMFSVPLAIFGGFLGLALAHWGTLLTTDQPVQQLDVLTFLGFVMLTGLVVKNAILLVEQSLVFVREHGLPPATAIPEAVRVRVRPVLMTTLTSIVGLLPLALMPGAGSELYRGLAAVLLGGLAVSTAGTLVLVPAVLGVVMRWRERQRVTAPLASQSVGATGVTLATERRDP